MRSDSDRTLVVAPRVRVQARLGEPTRVNAIYAADVWTSASVDIMASASKVPVTEQRDELDLSLDHELTDATLTIAYRFSSEPDYVSHGLSGGFSYDFAENNSTLVFGASASTDTVGRAGDPAFSRPASSLGARLGFTQVLGKNTLVQVMYELSRIAGYQSSPYRFVAIGGDGSCTALDGAGGFAPLCVPETNPGVRVRHALALQLRQAIGDDWSFGGAYRAYTDDWGILSHTIRGELAWSPDIDTILAVSYRLYTQSAADHYRAQYLEPQPYLTSDKELSPLSSQRVAVELERSWRFAHDRKLTSTLSVGPSYYAYSDFKRLSSIQAIEVNLALVFVP